MNFLSEKLTRFIADNQALSHLELPLSFRGLVNAADQNLEMMIFMSICCSSQISRLFFLAVKKTGKKRKDHSSVNALHIERPRFNPVWQYNLASYDLSTLSGCPIASIVAGKKMASRYVFLFCYPAFIT